MNKWMEYETRKKLLLWDLEHKKITHEEYHRLLEELCDKLGI